MSEIKFVTKKKVTVTCNTPFRIGKIPYSGICRNIILTIQDISECLTNHAKVVEVLSNGQEVPLDFSNYDTYNGPTDVTDNSEVLVEKPADPEIEQKNSKGETIKTINKTEEKKEEKKVIKVTTNINKTTEINADTKSTVEVTTDIKSDTNEQVKTEADNSNDTKVEVESKQQHNNNFQQNQKKNKFK